jgi:hypothetical protein
MAVPPVVVVPAIEVQVALSRMVANVPECKSVSVAEKYDATRFKFHCVAPA